MAGSTPGTTEGVRTCGCSCTDELAKRLLESLLEFDARETIASVNPPNSRKASEMTRDRLRPFENMGLLLIFDFCAEIPLGRKVLTSASDLLERGGKCRTFVQQLFGFNFFMTSLHC